MEAAYPGVKVEDHCTPALSASPARDAGQPQARRRDPHLRRRALRTARGKEALDEVGFIATTLTGTNRALVRSTINAERRSSGLRNARKPPTGPASPATASELTRSACCSESSPPTWATGLDL